MVLEVLSDLGCCSLLWYWKPSELAELNPPSDDDN